VSRRDATTLLGWTALLALATHSVVRYRWWLVAGYLVVAALVVTLAVTARDGRGVTPRPVPRAVPAAVLVLVAVVHLTVAPFSYLPPGDLWLVRAVLAAAVAVVAALLAVRPAAVLPVGLPVALAGAGVVAALVVVGDPAPAIDVWVILQQAADGLARGESMYAQVWTGSPGITDAFAYLPWTALLTAPGRWLAGDVRWALAVAVGLSALAVAALGRGRPGAVACAALLLLAPGSSTLVEQAWTEPTVLLGLAGWALLVSRGRLWWAVVPLAVALAAKQHVVLLLPLLAAWPRFGVRRTVVATGAAGLLVLPWFLAGPADFWHDTVRTMLDLPPLRFSDTVYVAVLNETGTAPPFALVGLAVAGVLVLAVVRSRRRPAGLAGVLTWSAAVLLVVNLVNKQAFYNQFWLVGALLLLAVAASTGAGAGAGAGTVPGAGRRLSGTPGRPRRPAGRPAGAPAPATPSDG